MQDTDLPLVVHLPVARKSLRVSVVTETYPPEVNGVATTVARFVQGLSARDHEVQLVRPRQGQDDDMRAPSGIEEVLRSGLSLPRYPSLRMGLPSRRALMKLWLKHRPDVVHVVTEGPLGWSALQAALRLGIPVSSDLRTNFHAYSRHYGVGLLRKPIVAYLRKFHNRTARTLVPTEAMRRDLAAIGFNNLQVVARGVDADLFSPARRSATLRQSWGATVGDPVVLHVGRLAPEKNLVALADGFDAIRANTPTARFVVVGDGPERTALQARCPYALFVGQRRGVDLAAHYASADVFLFPSLTETFGNVTLEAMASGLAVVAFDYAAAAEHLRRGETGVLAPCSDAHGWIEGAVRLCRDAAMIERMGSAARAVAQTLSWDAVTKQFESVLMDVASGAPVPGLSQPQGARAPSVA